MKKLTTFKLANLILFFLSLTTTACIFMFVSFGYCTEVCTLDFKVGFVNPLYNFFFSLTIITAIFLVLPTRYFKTWFTFILPVAAVLIFLHASNVSVYSSSILSMSRAEVVRFDMFLLGAVSVIYVIVMFARERLKKKDSAKS